MAPFLIGIQWWLKQPKVWRFVGFASAVVGLLCYALSSSFNYLFGEWNLLKKMVYSVFSFIICVVILYAKVWQPSASLRLKAHVAFLALTVTSFYSFFFDKAVNGKPDAYNLISCASFSVMSLSLSRQTNCGFEVDLLYFFLGALIVQLMKIKWLLGIVGACFSYSLIILRSWLDAEPEANGSIGFVDQPQVVIQVASLQLQPGAVSDSALVVATQEGSTHDQTITRVDSHSQEAGTGFALIEPQLLASIKALKKKSGNLIRTWFNSKHIHQLDKPDPNLLIDTLPFEIINNLHESMKLAMAAGFRKECCHMYSSFRREFLQHCLYDFFGIQDLDKEDDKVGDRTERIGSWTRAFQTTFLLLFPTERRLCDRVFFGFPSAGDLSFMLACRQLTIRLLNFANAFAVEIHSLKIFPSSVEVFKTLLDMVPELDSLFPDQSGVLLRDEAFKVRKGLGEAIRGTFLDFENLIHSDMGIADVPGGIYPITCDVVECLNTVITHWATIVNVFKEHHMVSNSEGLSPSIVAEMTRIVELLESRLEAEFKNYTEPDLCFVSMMNNVKYIIRKLRIVFYRRVLTFTEWSNWIEKYDAKVQQSLEDYQNSTWSEVLRLLKQDKDNQPMSPVEERLNLFNAQFDGICDIQSTWFVYDDVRKKIIISLENKLLPAYGDFIEMFQKALGTRANEYIRFGIIDVKNRLNQLFLGGKRMNREPKGQKSQHKLKLG